MGVSTVPSSPQAGHTVDTAYLLAAFTSLLDARDAKAAERQQHEAAVLAAEQQQREARLFTQVDKSVCARLLAHDNSHNAAMSIVTDQMSALKDDLK
jgi:hypothetical protein